MMQLMPVCINRRGFLKCELRSTLLDSIIEECTFFTYFSQFARILFALTSVLLHPVSVRTLHQRRIHYDISIIDNLHAHRSVG